MAKKNFLDIIKKQRASKKKEKFSGTLLDYLELVKENPDIIKLAHKRLYESIYKQGMETLDIDSEGYRPIFNGEKLRLYDYFSSDFYGMEVVTNKLLRFLKSAAHKGEESRQVLLLMGPVGAGKPAAVAAAAILRKAGSAICAMAGGPPMAQFTPTRISDTPITAMMLPVTTGGNRASRRLMKGAISMETTPAPITAPSLTS